MKKPNISFIIDSIMNQDYTQKYLDEVEVAFEFCRGNGKQLFEVDGLKHVVFVYEDEEGFEHLFIHGKVFSNIPFHEINYSDMVYELNEIIQNGNS